MSVSWNVGTGVMKNSAVIWSEGTAAQTGSMRNFACLMGPTLHEWPLFSCWNWQFLMSQWAWQPPQQYKHNTASAAAAGGSLSLFPAYEGLPLWLSWLKTSSKSCCLTSQKQPRPLWKKTPNKINQRPLAGSEGSCSLCLDPCRPSDWCKGQRVKGNLFKVKSPTDGLEIRTPQTVSLAAVRSFARAIWKD